MANPLKKETYKVSANRLNKFIACKYKLYLYLMDAPTTEHDTRYIDAGLAAHAYLEKALKNRTLVWPSEEEYDTMFREFNVTDPEMKARVKTSIQSGIAFLMIVDIDNAEAEKIILKEFVTPKGRNVTIDARLDLLISGENGLIVDYKTGMNVNKPEYSLQMQVYRFVTDFAYKAMCISLLSKEQSIVDKSNENFIPMLCDKYIDAIEGNDFERTEGYMCRFCEYYNDYCSEENRYRDPRTMISEGSERDVPTIEEEDI